MNRANGAAGGAGRVNVHKASVAMSAPPKKEAMAIGTTRRGARAGETPPGLICASSSSRLTAAAESSRRLWALSRHRRSTRRIGAGVLGGSVPQSGSARNTAASTCETVSPVNTGLPVSISRSTTPNDQMSLRLSAILPAACSGDM